MCCLPVSTENARTVVRMFLSDSLFLQTILGKRKEVNGNRSRWSIVRSLICHDTYEHPLSQGSSLQLGRRHHSKINSQLYSNHFVFSKMVSQYLTHPLCRRF